MAHADHDCSSHSGAPSVHQTLDELEFERGIWSSALIGDLDDVNRHICKNADVDRKDNSGYTALHYASRNGHLSVVRALVEAGADVKAVTKGGATPLHRAAYMGHTDILQYLLTRGADPLSRDGDGMTPLHKAAERNRLECAALLLKTSPSARDLKDCRGRTPSDSTTDKQLTQLLAQ